VFMEVWVVRAGRLRDISTGVEVSIRFSASAL
jgi:hypothetical protein